MTWFRMDDSIYDHPKMDDVSLAAAGLWALAGTYCARHLTDGVVSLRAIQRLGGDAVLAAELVAAGLWRATSDGWIFHDWHDYQPSRADILAEREKAKQRQKAWRDKRERNAVSNAVSNGVTNSAPTRPDPTRPDPEVHKSVAQKRATPPPPVLPITDAMRQWAATKAPGVNLEDETERLLDWARANGKTFKDWTAAWRNWIKKSKDFAPVNGNRPTPIPPTFDAAALRPADPIPMPDNIRQFKGASA